MRDSSDMELVRDYSRLNSEAAFAELVQRHIALVYSAALRHVGSSAHAEEITQAVFIILARKAAGLRADTILEGWLHETTRLMALSFLRGERRRQFREQEAYMQSTLQENNDAATWNQLAPLLDEAVSRLGKKDRDAVMLRFFKDKNLREVATALNVNEAAAQRRVHRAVEKLRGFFTKRGVALSSVVIMGAISANSVQAAPVALAKSVTAVAIVKGAAASISTLTLVKATIITMKTKTIAATAIIATLILGAGVGSIYAVRQHKMPSVTFAAKLPLSFTNSIFKQDGDRDGSFTVDLDTHTLRTSTSAPAIHIKGPIGAPNTRRASGSSDNSASTICAVGPGSPLLGKRICVTGWLKTRNAQNWASAFVIIGTEDYKSKGWSRVDSMSDRPIFGTTDWQQVKFVTDLPDQPCGIYFGPDLYGPGELWGDDFQISLADPDEAITDDRAWRRNSDRPGDYTVTTDTVTTHDGSPTLCFAYTGPENAAGKSWAWLGHHLRYPEIERYVGHTVRLSGWIKTENASGHLQPQIRPGFGLTDKDYKLLAKDSMGQDKSLSGTMDWTPFSLTCEIPKNTGNIVNSFIFWGGGKVWIDTNSLELTIVK